MDGGGPRPPTRVEDRADRQVRLRRRRGPDPVGSVCHLDVERIAVDVGVDRHRFQPELAECPHDPDGDLSAIGDEDPGLRHQRLRLAIIVCTRTGVKPLPLSEFALTRALERIGVQAPVRFDEVTRSTQLTARSLAEEGAPEWTLVAAAHQTEGRGRLDRRWVDEPGRALMFSMVLRPDLPPERGGLISLLAGWALTVGEGKAGGIIAESTLRGDGIEHVLLGVGVNVAAAPAIAGAAALGDVEPADVLGSFLVAFAGRYEPGHPAFPGATVSAYRKVCATIGTRVRVTTTAGLVTEGEAVDLDDAGGLVVRNDDGLEVVRFGDVEQLRRGATGGSG